MVASTGQKGTTNPSPREPFAISRRSIGDEPSEKDSLGFKPYVDAVSDFLLAPATQPPLTLSVEGEWGSGKSSFMKQLKICLEGPKFQETGRRRDRNALTVEFNPWRHEKEDALWAAFAVRFINEISGQLPLLRRLRSRFMLMRTRFDWREGWLDWVKAMGFAAAIVCIPIAAVLVVVFGGWKAVVDLIGKLPDTEDWVESLVTWLSGIGGAGTVLGSLIVLVGKVRSYLSEPLSFDLEKHLKSPDYGSRISFVENFHRDFKKIVDAYVGRKHAFVFIDDVDRCAVPKAAELMQAINLMIASDPRLFFIIGMDREKVAAGLAVKYEKTVPYITSAASGEATGSRIDALEFGYTFVEKFIQIPFLVPQPEETKLDTLLGIAGPERPGERSGLRTALRRLMSAFRRWLPLRLPDTDATAEGQTDDGAGRDLDRTRDHSEAGQKYRFMVSRNDTETLKGTLAWVAPHLDNNPRRMKQFINLFRLRVLISYETGLFDSSDTYEPISIEQLAKFVIITLKWPLLIRDLENEPDLLSKLLPDQDALPSGGPAVIYWAQRRDLIALLLHGCEGESRDDDFDMVRLDIKRLLSAWPHVRSTSPDSFAAVREALRALGLPENHFQSGTPDIASRIAEMQPLFNNARILWIDDLPRYNKKETTLFRSLGSTVDAAETTLEALAALERTEYDLIPSQIWSASVMRKPVSGSSHRCPAV